MSGPVEVKVSAATIASALSGLGLWALQTYVFHDDLPLPVVAAVTTIVPAIVTFLVGYLAPHTPRPDLQPPATLEPATTTEFTPAELADAQGAVVHTGDNPVDKPGRHERTES